MTVANTVTNVEQTEVALAQLVVDPRGHRGTHLEPGKMDWEFKCFVPPNHLARLLFVHWTKGVPAVDTGFSTYFKVGKAGGVDLFCSLSCQRIVESGEFSRLPEAGRRQSLAAWGFPESAGVTNAVRWDVNLGAGFTSSRWIAMPKYHRVSTVVPQFEFGRRLVVPLVEFDQSASGESNGWSGMELRFFLEPLKSSPIRTLPYETDMTNYVAGRGITGTMDEALQAINGNTESAELREARAKLAELRLRYTDKHPIVVELMMRIKHLEDK
jgi:hypothetical protein